MKIRILYILIILGIVITSATATPAFVEVRPLNRTGVPAAFASNTSFYFNNENMAIQVLLNENVSRFGLGYVSATFSPPGYSQQTANLTYPNSSSGGNYTYYLNFTIPGNVSNNIASVITITAVNGSGGGGNPVNTTTFVALININPEDNEVGLRATAVGATNWSTIPDYTNVQNLTFTKYNSSTFAYKLGNVEFLENINLADNTTATALQSFGTNMKMSSTYMDMNSAQSALAALNKQAKLSMYNLSSLFGGIRAGILVDGVPAYYANGSTNGSSSISGVDWSPDNNTINFTAAHWSNDSLQDQKAPTISSVASSSVTSSGATITWTTDLFANSLVKYGTTSGIENMTNTATESSTSTKSHSVTLTGLSASTTYYYFVNSTNSISTNSSQSSQSSFTTSASGGGSSSGSTGGGGVTTSEPSANIAKAESYDKSLIANTPVTYTFKAPELGVYEIAVTGKENENGIALRVEVLKGTSKQVTVQAPGTVYKNINIVTGTKRMKEALIRFRVENSWLGSNSLAGSDVKMLHWVGSQWTQLETAQTTKDDTYTYYEAKTVSFSPFAISGIKGGVLVPTATPVVTGTKVMPTGTGTPSPAPTKKVPAVEFVLTIAILSAAYLSGRMRR
jgi:PGF-pre-PGF domain-containing protein